MVAQALFRMILFLSLIVSGVLLLSDFLRAILSHNYGINSIIFFGLMCGIISCFKQVFQIKKEFLWMKNYEKGRESFPDVPSPQILSALANFNKGSHINVASSRHLLDSIEGRLEERRGFCRYLMGVLIFLGLLGTFWGLSQTIGSVANIINGLDISATDVKGSIENLKFGLQSPIRGMGTAFSCSLFGLTSSLIIGFLDLCVGNLFARFFQKIEETITPKLSSIDLSQNVSHGPAFSMALLEQTVEVMSLLQIQLKKSEDSRVNLAKSLQILTDQIYQMTEQNAQQQNIVKKIAQNQVALQEHMQDFMREMKKTNSKEHLQSIHTILSKSLEEHIEGRNTIIQELREEIRLVAKTISSLANQEMAA